MIDHDRDEFLAQCYPTVIIPLIAVCTKSFLQKKQKKFSLQKTKLQRTDLSFLQTIFHTLRTMLAFLFSMVGVIAFCGYIPQIIALWRTQSRSEDVSLLTWLIWISTWIISFLYAWLEIHDLRFMFVSGVNIFCHLCVIGLVIRNRYLRAYK